MRKAAKENMGLAALGVKFPSFAVFKYLGIQGEGLKA